MKCAICDLEFESAYKHKRTCSSVCSKRLKIASRSKWISENRDYFNSYKREYHKTKDKERVALKNKMMRKTDSFRKKRRLQQKKRLARDPVYRAVRALRKRLWEYKQRHGTVSLSKSMGCSWEEFKTYIESKFYPRRSTGECMSWDNYGKGGWEMDHIVPLCTASSVEDLAKLSHYTNLQPLWREDNNLKSLNDLKIKSDFRENQKDNQMEEFDETK